VPCVGERRGTYRVLVGKPEGKKWVRRVWTGLIWMRMETSGRLL
jgi:hypothetical protein